MRKKNRVHYRYWKIDLNNLETNRTYVFRARIVDGKTSYEARDVCNCTIGKDHTEDQES